MKKIKEFIEYSNLLRCYFAFLGSVMGGILGVPGSIKAGLLILPLSLIIKSTKIQGIKGRLIGSLLIMSWYAIGVLMGLLLDKYLP
jgi:hypothetical protein